MPHIVPHKLTIHPTFGLFASGHPSFELDALDTDGFEKKEKKKNGSLDS